MDEVNQPQFVSGGTDLESEHSDFPKSKAKEDSSRWVAPRSALGGVIDWTRETFYSALSYLQPHAERAVKETGPAARSAWTVGWPVFCSALRGSVQAIHDSTGWLLMPSEG
jgi:hypothetical protein